MATRSTQKSAKAAKATKKSAKSARGTTRTTRTGAARKATRTTARTPPKGANGARRGATTGRTAPKKATKAAAPAARKVRQGFIAHTELASADPAATKAWAQQVLGWKFMDPMPTPNGPYHMWSFGDNMGGGIRANNPPEMPGSIPYVEVADIRTAYNKALQGGAREMLSPQEIPGGMGSIAIVMAPGGPAIGFWSTK